MQAPRGFALVTGASAGLGEELCHRFAADGINVIAVARRQARLQSLCDKLTQRHGTQNHPIVADLSDPEGAMHLVNKVQELGVFVEFLVNNAGLGHRGAFLQNRLEDELCMVDVNMRAMVVLCHRFLPAMVENKRGHVLNIGSLAGFQAGPYMATYYATKSFVHAFSEGLHFEMREHGVWVTASCPGPTHTEFAKHSGLDKAKLFDSSGVATASDVADAAYEAMRKGHRLTVVGFRNNLLVQLQRWVPRAAGIRVAQWLNSTKG